MEKQIFGESNLLQKLQKGGLTLKQDGTKVVSKVNKYPDMTKYMNTSRGTIGTPYEPSIRESIMRTMDKFDSNGENAVAGIVTQPIKSAMRLLRPDNYYRGDDVVGHNGGLGQMVMDMATVSPMLGLGKKAAPIKNTATNYSGDMIIHNLDDLAEVESQFATKKPTIIQRKVKEALDAKVLPIGKRMTRPNNLKFEYSYSDGMDKISAVDDSGNSWGKLLLEDSGYGDLKPAYIGVDPKVRGLKMQDALYQKGIDLSKSYGGNGLRSGDHLISPKATYKAWERFNTAPGGASQLMERDAAILLGHKNPNIIDDWLTNYQNNVPKKLGREKISVNDIFSKINNKPKLQQNLPIRLNHPPMNVDAHNDWVQKYLDREYNMPFSKNKSMFDLKLK